VDANFREEAWRQAFFEAASRWGVHGLFLLCQAEPDIVRKRLASRRDDASDADWPVYLKAAETWEEPSTRTRSALETVETGGSMDHALSQAIKILGLRISMAEKSALVMGLPGEPEAACDGSY
jgi:predicted kinase